jgi:hypothetical protein
MYFSSLTKSYFNEVNSAEPFSSASVPFAVYNEGAVARLGKGLKWLWFSAFDIVLKF